MQYKQLESEDISFSRILLISHSKNAEIDYANETNILYSVLNHQQRMLSLPMLKRLLKAQSPSSAVINYANYIQDYSFFPQNNKLLLKLQLLLEDLLEITDYQTILMLSILKIIFMLIELKRKFQDVIIFDTMICRSLDAFFQKRIESSTYGFYSIKIIKILIKEDYNMVKYLIENGLLKKIDEILECENSNEFIHIKCIKCLKYLAQSNIELINSFCNEKKTIFNSINSQNFQIKKASMDFVLIYLINLASTETTIRTLQILQNEENSIELFKLNCFFIQSIVYYNLISSEYAITIELCRQISNIIISNPHFFNNEFCPDQVIINSFRLLIPEFNSFFIQNGIFNIIEEIHEAPYEVMHLKTQLMVLFMTFSESVFISQESLIELFQYLSQQFMKNPGFGLSLISCLQSLDMDIDNKNILIYVLEELGTSNKYNFDAIIHDIDLSKHP